MGIVAYYVGQYIDGKNACLHAINYCKQSDAKINTDIDEKNLKFYLEKEQEEIGRHTNPQVVSEICTKKKFIEQKMAEIKKENPKLTDKQIHTRANMLWKNSRKK